MEYRNRDNRYDIPIEKDNCYHHVKIMVLIVAFVYLIYNIYPLFF